MPSTVGCWAAKDNVYDNNSITNIVTFFLPLRTRRSQKEKFLLFCALSGLCGRKIFAFTGMPLQSVRWLGLRQVLC